MYEDSLSDSYTTQLLAAYAKNPIAKGSLKQYTVRYEEGNPTCGDGLEVYLVLDGQPEDQPMHQYIRAYSRDGDAKTVARAAASLLAEYIIDAPIADVMTRDHTTMASWGLVVSDKRMHSVVLPLLAVRNAIHRRYGDQMIEDVEDMIGW